VRLVVDQLLPRVRECLDRPSLIAAGGAMWAPGGWAALLGSRATLRAKAGIRSAGTMRRRI